MGVLLNMHVQRFLNSCAHGQHVTSFSNTFQINSAISYRYRLGFPSKLSQRVLTMTGLRLRGGPPLPKDAFTFPNRRLLEHSLLIVRSWQSTILAT